MKWLFRRRAFDLTDLVQIGDNLMHIIEAFNAKLAEKMGLLRAAQDEIKQKDIRIQNLQDFMAEKDIKIDVLEKTIRDLNPEKLKADLEAARAEVAAMVAERAIDWLDAPIVRVGARDTPMPYNDKLERLVIPSADDIVEAVRRVVLRDSIEIPRSA